MKKTALLTGEERSVAEWVAQNNRHAGATTGIFPDSPCLYLAIRINQRVYGVAGIATRGEKLDSFENSVLLSMLSVGYRMMEL